MVEIYVHGKSLGTLSENANDLAQLLQCGVSIEFRTNGTVMGKYVPSAEPICPWEPELTKEEIDRRCQEKGKPLAEILRQLGAE